MGPAQPHREQQGAAQPPSNTVLRLRADNRKLQPRTASPLSNIPIKGTQKKHQKGRKVQGFKKSTSSV